MRCVFSITAFICAVPAGLMHEITTPSEDELFRFLRSTIIETDDVTEAGLAWIIADNAWSKAWRLFEEALIADAT